MKVHSEQRYQADSTAASAAQFVAFPVRIFVRKANYAAALSAARAMLGQVEKAATELRVGTIQTEIDRIGCNHDGDQKNGAGVDLHCSLVLSMDRAAPLWPRSEVVVRMLDLIQTFVEQARQLKDVQVLTGQAQNRPKGAGGPAPDAGAPR
jgi:hypothetical protein